MTSRGGTPARHREGRQPLGHARCAAARSEPPRERCVVRHRRPTAGAAASGVETVVTSVAVPKPPTPASRPAVQPKPRILGLFSPEGAVMAGLLTAAFVALYFRWFWTQHGFSSHQVEDWGHSYLIPVISGYMIWQ